MGLSPPSVLGAALVLVAATLTLGCARLLATVNADQTESELAGLVDSDAARRLLADILARHPRDPRLAAAAPTPRAAGVVEGGDREASRILDQAQELARETSVDFAALTFARALNPHRGLSASQRPPRAPAPHSVRGSSHRPGSTMALAWGVPTCLARTATPAGAPGRSRGRRSLSRRRRVPTPAGIPSIKKAARTRRIRAVTRSTIGHGAGVYDRQAMVPPRSSGAHFINSTMTTPQMIRSVLPTAYVTV
jgi:hypothetical protein